MNEFGQVCRSTVRVENRESGWILRWVIWGFLKTFLGHDSESRATLDLTGTRLGESCDEGYHNRKFNNRRHGYNA